MYLLLMSLEGFKRGHHAGFHTKNKNNYCNSLMNKTGTWTGESPGRVRERERERGKEKERERERERREREREQYRERHSLKSRAHDNFVPLTLAKLS
jgi:hypothetical protein